jgi:hypothetical protein
MVANDVGSWWNSSGGSGSGNPNIAAPTAYASAAAPYQAATIGGLSLSNNYGLGDYNSGLDIVAVGQYESSDRGTITWTKSSFGAVTTSDPMGNPAGYHYTSVGAEPSTGLMAAQALGAIGGVGAWSALGTAAKAMVSTALGGAAATEGYNTYQYSQAATQAYGLGNIKQGTAYLGNAFISGGNMAALGYGAAVSLPGTTPSGLTTPSGGQLRSGATLYRVHGGPADEFGSYWTTVDPTVIPNYRAASGLPLQNTGRSVTVGTLADLMGVSVRSATAISRITPANALMVPEVYVPNPAFQIKPVTTFDVNPPF